MSWQELSPNSGVYTADYRIPGLPCRSYAVRLTDGTFAVLSPGTSLLDEPGLDGRVSALVAPSNYHWLGIPKWREKHTDAQVIASADARPRLESKGLSLTSSIDALRELLPRHVQLVEMPKTRTGEIWLRVDTTQGLAWMVCDAFFNMPRPRKLGARITQNMLKSGPGLAISQLMKWGGLKDRRTARHWLLDRLEQDAPTILVPTHGEILKDNTLPQTVRSLIERRL